MNRINVSILIFSCIAVLGLTACVGGGGYTTSPWDYTTPPQTGPAEAAPKTLADAHIQGQRIEQTKEAGETTGPAQPAPYETLKNTDLPTVKVGLLLPLSGKHEALGQAMLRASQLALFDIAHANFELLPRDTAGTAQGARNAAREVVAEGAELIIGPVFSDAVRAVKSVAQNAHINVIGFSTDWTLAGGNTFIMGFMPFDQIDRLADYVAKKNTLSSVSIIAPRSDYGQIVTSSWQSKTAQLGIPSAKVTNFSLSQPNLAPLMRTFTEYDEREIKAKEMGTTTLKVPASFDAVLIPAGGETALSIANLLNHYDLPPSSVQRLGTGLFDDEGLATEQSLYGAWFAAPSPKLRRSFERRYQATYNKIPPRLASLSYDATALAAVLAQRGLKTSGRPDFTSAAITNPNGFSGIDGIFRFRANGTAERGLAILEYKRGTIRVLEDAPKTFQNMGY